MEDGKHMGSGFCPAREMITQPPGKLQLGWLRKTPASHVLDIQAQAFRALIRLFGSRADRVWSY